MGKIKKIKECKYCKTQVGLMVVFYEVHSSIVTCPLVVERYWHCRAKRCVEAFRMEFDTRSRWSSKDKNLQNGEYVVGHLLRQLPPKACFVKTQIINDELVIEVDEFANKVADLVIQRVKNAEARKALEDDDGVAAVVQQFGKNYWKCVVKARKLK